MPKKTNINLKPNLTKIDVIIYTLAGISFLLMVLVLYTNKVDANPSNILISPSTHNDTSMTVDRTKPLDKEGTDAKENSAPKPAEMSSKEKYPALSISINQPATFEETKIPKVPNDFESMEVVPVGSTPQIGNPTTEITTESESNEHAMNATSTNPLHSMVDSPKGVLTLTETSVSQPLKDLDATAYPQLEQPAWEKVSTPALDKKLNRDDSAISVKKAEPITESKPSLPSDNLKDKSKSEKEKYTVKRGDFLWKIAENHHVEMWKLIKMNNIKNPNLIFPGDQLIIPIR